MAAARIDPIEPEGLFERVRRVTDAALERGALLPIRTSFERIEHEGVRFLVRVVRALERKDAQRTAALAAQGGSRVGANPFLDPEPDLRVGDVSDTHRLVLNKFNVVEHHVLIVTRTFEPQTGPLTRADLEALWTCMAGYDALGFYNAGTVAGASQPHRHLQLVPLPLGPDGPPTPVDPVVTRTLASAGRGSATVAGGLPFTHELTGFAPGVECDPAAAARDTLERYRELMRRAGLADQLDAGAAARPRPYNLLVTRRWMMLVPRARECFGPISVNALGFAGTLLARNRDELALLRSRGPMTALREVAGATPPQGAAAPGSPSPGPNDCSAR